MPYPSFKDYVLSGRFNKVASEAVTEAIEKAKAAGLPVEGCASTESRQSRASELEVEKTANRPSHRK